MSDTISFLKSKNPKFGKIYKFIPNCSIGERNTIIKNVNMSLIAECYDCSVSLKENYEAMKNLKIRVSKNTLYRFCKAYGISTRGYQDTDIDIMKHYDYQLSLRENFKLLKKMGYKISLGRLCKLVKERQV